jgi:homotetrameric cytidine deaminase
MARHERVVDDGHSVHAHARYSLGAVSGPRRNVELKAVDPDPARTLERALALGAADRGVIVQRDTYFRVSEGRLKLREEEPGEAHLIAYARPDDPAVRVSSYRVVPAGEELLAALTETLGVDVVVEKRRHLLLWETVRIHLDEVSELGSFVELEAVAHSDSDLSREHAQVEQLREELRIDDAALREGSYADTLRKGSGGRAWVRVEGSPDPDPELLRLAREAAGRAYAPYSGFPVGAAVRTEDGRRYAGANVENAAYPQGQCAEASALGAMVAGGGGRVVEVVVAAPSEAECAPCGGCRQRLREFADADAPIHLADLERVRRTASLGELLPLSFGPESLA